MSSFKLQHSSCSGMYWRSDPRKAGGAKSLSDDNWPRNGAILTGTAFEHGGEKVSVWTTLLGISGFVD